MTLPIEEALPRLREALTGNTAVVLQAPPGAGKTTMVPLALLDEPWLKGKGIVMLEPRRLAARAAAGRMSQLRGENVGAMVGYRIRFESKVSKATRIEVLTEGILTRRLQNDPALEGVGLVIFDEFHERHLHADLALALCLDSQRGLRDDLKILVMSATLDGAAVSRLLNNAPIITSEGRSYPVDVQYLARDPEGRLPDVVAQAILRALAEHEGDVLAFLPGAWEIRRTQSNIEATLRNSNIDIYPLYGDLPWEQQERAIRPGGAEGRRKVVLATPIAETSLTIDGVRVVVDSGYARVPQFDPKSGLSRLVTQRISRASAEQRAGRAGRTAPGVCYRLWGETTQRGLIPQAIPEIRSADLVPLALELSAWGVQDATSLAWLDPPPAASLAQARDLLVELDALDEQGRITAAGRAMAQLPLHPRLAHMLRAAEKMQRGALACDIAALISERDILMGEARRSCDLTERLDVLRVFRQQGRKGAEARGGRSRHPASATAPGVALPPASMQSSRDTGASMHGADANGCARVDQAARQWRRLIGARDEAAGFDPDDAGQLLALAYPDRIAQQRAPNGPAYLLANGRGARLPEWEIRLRQPLLVAATLDAGEGEGLIYLAATLRAETLPALMPGHVKSEEEVRWDAEQQIVVARRVERLGALVLDSAPLKKAEPGKLRAAMLEGVRRMGLDVLPWTDEARQWQARVLSLRQWFPEEDWPDVSDSALAATLDGWLAPYLDGITRRDHLARLDLPGMLKAHLDWKQGQQLDSDAPTHISVPSGSQLKLEYKPGESPVLAVKLQEMFGLADTPRIARGRVPVTLHLLSPARRPIQVTQDLRGFWERTYAEVKKELKGRYPKHPWPDDPWNAVPTARAKRRS
ncbi:MAG TPA: ATP-dependent helicase HrpB [Acidiferrobacterales bacterium]|nr:ATP-dependent helicase HrpB [Acidiferrobacterales bacterium]